MKAYSQCLTIVEEAVNAIQLTHCNENRNKNILVKSYIDFHTPSG